MLYFFHSLEAVKRITKLKKLIKNFHFRRNTVKVVEITNCFLKELSRRQLKH